jgi:hypothetical protein
VLLRGAISGSAKSINAKQVEPSFQVDSTRHCAAQSFPASSTSGAVGAATGRTHTDDFIGDANAAPDSSLWTVKTVASGTVALDGTGKAAIASASSATDGALLWRAAALDVGVTSTRKLRLRVLSSPAFDVLTLLGLSEIPAPVDPQSSAGSPAFTAPNGKAAFSDAVGHCLFRINIVYNSGSPYMQLYRAVDNLHTGLRCYNFASDGWATTEPANAAVALDTDYVLVFENLYDDELLTSSFRVTLLAADETTIVHQSGWCTYDDLPTMTNSPLMFVGDPFTNVYQGKLTLDWYNEA